MPILAFILTAILIKTSLLGLGLLSVGLALLALLVLKLNLLNLNETLHKRFAFKFKLVVFAHLGAYGLLILKLTFIDGWNDVPAFIVSHLITHHVLCALIAGTLTWLAIGTYNTIRQSQTIPTTKT